jgi:formylmethanofuran:tetrahydromethanopterin formyltransferase
MAEIKRRMDEIREARSRCRALLEETRLLAGDEATRACAMHLGSIIRRKRDYLGIADGFYATRLFRMQRELDSALSVAERTSETIAKVKARLAAAEGPRLHPLRAVRHPPAGGAQPTRQDTPS